MVYFADQLVIMKLVLFVATFFFVCNITAQDMGSISGKILDNEMDLEPMINASVSLKNSGMSTQTNFHGNFEISGINSGDYILVINYPGYETQEVPVTVKNRAHLEISKVLKALTIELEEVGPLYPSISVSPSERQ